MQKSIEVAPLHVRYRPVVFEDVLGQPKIIKSLKRVVADGRAKTFMFTGPAGTGKTTLARILANAFAGGKATVANIEEVDAATKSGADDMREIIHRTHFRAIGESPVKAIIVDECHRLSSAAWTILLKPTEEPPKHVYWMLCSTEPGKIPKTIQTRFLRYDLKAVDEENIFKLLDKVSQAEKLNVSDEVLEAITEGSGGSPRQALVFLEACLYAESASNARAIMRSAGQATREIIDLCRFLLKGQGMNWAEAMKYVNALEGTDAEGIRLSIVGYLTAVLKGAKSERSALPALRLLGCFGETYHNSSEKHAPLLRSLGKVLEME